MLEKDFNTYLSVLKEANNNDKRQYVLSFRGLTEEQARIVLQHITETTPIFFGEFKLWVDRGLILSESDGTLRMFNSMSDIIEIGVSPKWIAVFTEFTEVQHY